MNRLPILLKFFNHLNLTPEEAVEWQRHHPGDYRFLDAAFEYLSSDVHLSRSTKRSRYYMIRGFFRRNRAALPVDESPRFHSERVPVHSQMSVDELRKLLLSCNLMYRALFLMMFQAGLGCEGLIHVNLNEVEAVRLGLACNTQVLRLNLPGRKQNRNIHPYYTFIGGDAVSALKQHLHSQGYVRDNVLFRTEKGKPVSRSSIENYFRNHLIQTGLVKRRAPKCPECQGETVRSRRVKQDKVTLQYICATCGVKVRPESNKHLTGGIRYGKNPHELRDLFLTEWHRSGADLSAGNFFMGHTIDPLGYDKIMHDGNYALTQYRKAAPYLNILSDEPRKVDSEESKRIVDDALAKNMELEEDNVRKDLEISKLNEMFTTEFQKVYAAFDSLKEEHRKTMEELDKPFKSTIPEPIQKALREEIRKEARKVAKKLKEESSL